MVIPFQHIDSLFLQNLPNINTLIFTDERNENIQQKHFIFDNLPITLDNIIFISIKKYFQEEIILAI